ncbi:stationary-phase survival protein SurE [Methanococcus vannielii SB]|uniref:5'-nucleotidase SurE n=1 Tax=Methanococcus vannielii (strain ATCC 35089 / DSM 1224 / JCM 13029 / OCM 148 / SB) TaxID=406327 RepID=SURE_METVS|nr:5'/3'-nucleotidase SurE [Methanococcus vannielii]A6UP61.1 RecName: Full=5'-nucleotidase SurE; AltName: Full=Nucleoside 5'-monophosphate phosphohydrolase [Methanococcus vannielii SB]ABR54283.1 stationary-phase survival protein SurE [Methanococcus vannielii SB]
MTLEILLVNDDGIYSNGLLALKNVLSSEFDANVTVVAPTNQQSGIGRAISFFEPLRITKTKLSDCSEGYAVSGTPSDCVVLGIYQVLKKVPDFVISGINIGENLGTEITTSGTLGAAFEGSHHGAKAFACSLQVTADHLKFKEGESPIEFLNAANVFKKVFEKFLDSEFPCDVLNVNIPEDATLNTPVEITKLAKKMYTTHVEERIDPRSRSYYWIDGYPIMEEEDGTDVYAIRRKKHVSLTPLTLDTTIKNIELFQEIYKKKF